MFRFSVIIAFCFLVSAASGNANPVQGDALSPRLAKFVSVNAKMVAIEHARVIDGTGKAPEADRTIVISGGKIVSIEPATAPIPAGATVVDATGKTLLPGYVGAHNHLFNGVADVYRSMTFSFPKLYLAAGTTTIRTTGSYDIYADLAIKKRIDEGLSAGPDVDVTSPYLTGPGNVDEQMDELRDAADARATVDFWADHGVTSFKVYENISHDALAAVIDQAHKRGLKVMGHLCSVGYSEAAALGIDELEHGPYFTDTEFMSSVKPGECPSLPEHVHQNAALNPNGPQIATLIRDLVRKHTAVSSTLPIFETLIPNTPTDAELVATFAVMDHEQRDRVVATRKAIADGSFFGGFVGPDHKTYPHIVADIQTAFRNEMAFEVKFERAGGLLTCGPDPSGYGLPIAGYGDWREIELLVKAGFSPVEAIHVATENGAIALGRIDSVGTIAVGKLADLILVDGDPSIDIKQIEKVQTVFKDGIGYDPAKLVAAAKGLVGLE